MALLRKHKNDYQLLATVENRDLVDQAVISTFRRNCAKVPTTVRLIAEVISTQTLPNEIAEQRTKLADKSKYKVKDSKEALYQLRRLLYVANGNTFILSTNRSDVGVVTIAHPREKIIDSAEDVALAVGDRRYIEDELIYTGDLAWYTADGKDLVPQNTEENPSTHKLELTNTAIKGKLQRKRNIRFYPLSAYGYESTRGQAVVKTGVEVKPKYVAKLTHKWLERLNALFLSQWLMSHKKGTKMSRDTYAVLQLAFAKTMVTIFHSYENDKFSHDVRIDYEESVEGKGTVRSLVLSKDVPARVDWTRFCNSGGLSQGISLTDFKG